MILTSCQENNKSQNKVDIKIETENGLSTAIITTEQKINEKDSIITIKLEGTKEEVINELKDLGYYIKEMDSKSIKKIKLSLSPKSGSDVNGEVTFVEENKVIKMTADISGLSSGVYAIHIHEKADCSSNDGKSTGGHWNPTFENHGQWGNKNGFHRGDIGNFQVDTSGQGKFTFSTNLWCLGCKDDKKNIIGKAIIVHQGEDDFVSQPSGAAGARISCSAIIK